MQMSYDNAPDDALTRLHPLPVTIEPDHGARYAAGISDGISDAYMGVMVMWQAGRWEWPDSWAYRRGWMSGYRAVKHAQQATRERKMENVRRAASRPVYFYRDF